MTTYEAWLSGRGLSHTTIHARRKFYRSRLADWGTFDLPADTLATWLRQYTGWTRSTYHWHLSSVYDWMVEEGALVVNPMRTIKRPPIPKPHPRPLTEVELSAALDAATARTRAFLLLGYLAGLRAHEIAKMHGRDIDEHRLRVVGKGGVDSTLPTHPLLWTLAQGYPRDGYWFPGPLDGHARPGSVTDSVRRVFRSLGIEGAAHRARHTFGTRLLRGGATLRVVQELMRHASLATTALYLGVEEEERHAAILGLVA